MPRWQLSTFLECGWDCVVFAVAAVECGGGDHWAGIQNCCFHRWLPYKQKEIVWIVCYDAHWTEFKFRKNWCPIWSVKTSFCQKRYGILYDWSLERDLETSCKTGFLTVYCIPGASEAWELGQLSAVNVLKVLNGIKKNKEIKKHVILKELTFLNYLFGCNWENHELFCISLS